jgi:hypothetical protein
MKLLLDTSAYVGFKLNRSEIVEVILNRHNSIFANRAGGIPVWLSQRHKI